MAHLFLNPFTLSTLVPPVTASEAVELARDAGTQAPFWQSWPQQADLLQACRGLDAGWATILIVLGLVYLVFGYFIFKWLVTLNAVIAGCVLGVWAGGRFGQPIPAAVAGGVVAAAVTWPSMRFAVALLGGAFGFGLGVSVWNGLAYDPRYAVAGGLIGLVFLAMLSFVVHKQSVILFMCIQGSLMLVVGAVTLTYKIDGLGDPLHAALVDHRLILPLALFIPALAGLIYQNTGAAEADDDD